MTEHYYHLFANGDDARNFITTEEEFKAAFNRFGVCSHYCGVEVDSCSIEDSHPHGLLHGTLEKCLEFKDMYEDISIRSIIQKRGSKDGVNLHCELYEVTDDQYLRNVASYTIVQATKDGKAVMPYDYRFGTGSLYFRNKYSILPWLIDDDGNVCEPVRYGSLTVREKKILCSSRKINLPDDWMVCNGFILPTNFINIRRFEQIYRTHNCFRVFLSASKVREEEIVAKMASVRGVMIDDLEARKLTKDTCTEMFGTNTVRSLNPEQRISLGLKLRNINRLSPRQISLMTYIPESEIRKYIK